jgi:hypothetical protein
MHIRCLIELGHQGVSHQSGQKTVTKPEVIREATLDKRRTITISKTLTERIIDSTLRIGVITPSTLNHRIRFYLFRRNNVIISFYISSASLIKICIGALANSSY